MLNHQEAYHQSAEGVLHRPLAVIARWFGVLSTRDRLSPTEEAKPEEEHSQFKSGTIRTTDQDENGEAGPLRLVPDYYAGSVTNEELNRPRRSPAEFSEAELSDTRSVEDYFARRRAILAKSTLEGADGHVRYGSANQPQIGDEFAADWRELLPESHPQRLIGPPLVIAGTREADDTLMAAHDAMCAAMRTASEPPDS
jgi:hypothetical protein